MPLRRAALPAPSLAAAGMQGRSLSRASAPEVHVGPTALAPASGIGVVPVIAVAGSL